jgi:polygalacturonase
MRKISLILLISYILPYKQLKAQEGWKMAEQIVKNLNPVLFPKAEYNVMDFGATADNSSPNKDAFNKAITHCSENGGGSVIVPAGTYYMNGSIILKSNVNLHLKENAIINFSSIEDDYLPAVLTRWEGTELYNYSPLIYAYHVNNIAVTGKGILNGNGAKMFASWKNKQKKDQELLRKMGRELEPVYKRVFGKGTLLRPGFFEPFGCTSVRLEGVTLNDSPFWVIHPIFCNSPGKIYDSRCKVFSDSDHGKKRRKTLMYESEQQKNHTGNSIT